MKRSLSAFTDVFMCLLQVVIYIQLVLEAYMAIGQKILYSTFALFVFISN